MKNLVESINSDRDIPWPAADLADTNDDMTLLEKAFESTMQGLNPNQQEFVRQYKALGFVPTLAAKRAGYSVKTAYSISSRLLKIPKIQYAISLLKQIDQLKHGVALEYKRIVLIETIEHCRRPGKLFNPSAMAKLIDILCKLDNNYPDTKLSGALAGATVNIQYNIAMPTNEPKVIDVSD